MKCLHVLLFYVWFTDFNFKSHCCTSCSSNFQKLKQMTIRPPSIFVCIFKYSLRFELEKFCVCINSSGICNNITYIHALNDYNFPCHINVWESKWEISSFAQWKYCLSQRMPKHCARICWMRFFNLLEIVTVFFNRCGQTSKGFNYHRMLTVINY